MRKRTLFIGAVIGALAVGGAAAPASASPARTTGTTGTAVVSVLHEVPNVPVDVYINHHLAINDFQPGSYVNSLKVPAGKYTISITAATAKNDHSPVIGPVVLTFASHDDYTLVAHLTPAGAPTASLYDNSLKHTNHGFGRLIVRHDAAAPAVDILANGTPTMKHLTNPKQSTLQVPAATYQVAVALAGSTTPVIGPVALRVTKGQDTIVYAWGSASSGDLAAAVQRITVHGGVTHTSFAGLKRYSGHISL